MTNKSLIVGEVMAEFATKPMTELELLVSNPLPLEDSDKVVMVTEQHKETSKKLLLLSLQLSMLSYSTQETKKDRAFAAGLAPMLQAIVTGVLPDVSEYLKIVARKGFDSNLADKAMKECLAEFETLLVKAKLAAIHYHNQAG